MPFLPIAERELRVAARRRATYRTRFWAVLIVLMVFTWQFLSLTAGRIPSAMHGKMLFTVISMLAFVYCLFIGARVTADCLSEEKREGTLGLLFLTDLKGYDVVFGKLASSSLNAIYGLLAIFPILGICFLLGGVTFGQFAKTVLALLTTLFFSLSAGIFVSAYNRQERVAMFFTVLVVLLFAAGPPFFAEKEYWPVWLLSPGLALLLAIDPTGGFSGLIGPNAYWWGLTVTWLITTFFLWRASFIIPHSWQEKGPKPLASKLVSFRLPQADKVQDKKFRAQALEINPYLWLTLRGREKLNHVWGFVIAIIVIWFSGFLRARDIMLDFDLLFPVLLFIHAFLKVWVISEACTRLVEDRRSSALELLLSTPLDVKEIVHGQHLALRRQFAAPFLLLIVLEAVCFFLGFAGRQMNWSEKLFLPAAIILFVADFFTLRWVAMWIGLNAKHVNRAVLKTAMLVLAMPWIIYKVLSHSISFFHFSRANSSSFFFSKADSDIKEITPVLCWLGLALLINFILFRWAKPRLLSRFRLLATQPVREIP